MGEHWLYGRLGVVTRPQVAPHQKHPARAKAARASQHVASSLVVSVDSGEFADRQGPRLAAAITHACSDAGLNSVSTADPAGGLLGIKLCENAAGSAEHAARVTRARMFLIFHATRASLSCRRPVSPVEYDPL